MPKRSIIKENYSSKALVEMWGDFIDWEKRRKGERHFLKRIMEKNKASLVFESCLGDGCDSVYLIKQSI